MDNASPLVPSLPPALEALRQLVALHPLSAVERAALRAHFIAQNRIVRKPNAQIS